jgi:vitamin B12 transporter
MFSLARAAVAAALCGAFCAVPALAQPNAAAPQASPSPAATAIPEIGRVVTSDRRAEALAKASRPTYVVDRSTIEAFGARSVADALANVPGVSIFAYGPFGAQANYGIRGTTSSETLVLRDGVPVGAGSSASIDLGSLSTIGIGRIEVVESGASTLYGSSATGGVINLISAGASAPYLRISDGTLGNRDLALGASSGGLTFSFERHVATNVYDFPSFGAGALAIPAGTRTNADAQQTALRLGYRVDVGAGWSARLSLGSDAVRIGVPGSTVFGTTPDARQNTNRSDAALDLEHALGGGTFTLTLAGSTQQLAFADPGPSLGGEDDTYDARSQASLRYTASSAHGDIVAGIDLSRENAALSFTQAFGPALPIAAAEAQTAAYAQVGLQATPGLHVAVGLRGEHDAPLGGVLAPSFGATVTFGALRLTANAGESYRVPTLIDLYYPGFSNPNLVPERLTNYDATVHANAGTVALSAGIFGRDGSNLIALDPATFIPFNASRVSANGIALDAAVRLSARLQLTAGLTNLYRALDTSTGQRIPNTPPIVATLGIERPFGGGRWAFGGRVRVVGATANDGPQPLLYDRRADADLYARYRTGPAGIVTLRVRNAADVRYMPINGYPAPGHGIEVEFATR